MTNIGINVIETEGSAAPAIAGAPTSVTGVLVRSRRGPADRAVRVSNFRQFLDRIAPQRGVAHSRSSLPGTFARISFNRFSARMKRLLAPASVRPSNIP